MRCAWLIYGPLSQPTGGYVYDRMIVEGLRAAGYSVDVLDLGPPRDGSRLERDNLGRVLAALRERRYDCVIGDELCHPELATLFERLKAGPRRAPRLLLLVHHLGVSETGLMVESERRVLELADHVVTTSFTTARQVARWVDASPGVCLPGADRLPRLPHSARRGDDLALLFVGTWTSRKGLLRTLQYLQELPDANCTLQVVGDTTREPSYAAVIWSLLGSVPRLRERTRVYGVLSDAELAVAYATSDLLVLPSSYEGYGMVLTEALHAGVPVLAADVGATSEVVRHGHDGLLLPLDEPEVWVNVLRQLANDRARIESWAAELRQLPTWAESIASFARIIERSATQVSVGGSETRLS